jgi:hypothetical protein
MSSQFAFLRVRAANRFNTRIPWPPTEEWLIVEWPDDAEEPLDFWLSNRPRTPRPSSSRAWPGCVGRSSWTTSDSRASSASTTTRAAPGWGGATTPP